MRVFFAVTATSSNPGSFPSFYFLHKSMQVSQQPVLSAAFTLPLPLDLFLRSTWTPWKPLIRFPSYFVSAASPRFPPGLVSANCSSHLLPLLLQPSLFCLPQLLIICLVGLFFLGWLWPQFFLQGQTSLLLSTHYCLHFDNIYWPDKKSLCWMRKNY